MKVTITSPIAHLTVELDAHNATALMQMALARSVPETTIMSEPAEKEEKQSSHHPMCRCEVKIPAKLMPTKKEEPAEEPAPAPATATTITPPVAPVAAPQSDDGFDPDMDDRVGFSAEEESPTKGYRGFLHMKCGKCHKEKSFCVKKPLKEYRCACGHTTPMKGLNKVVAKCDCGWDIQYYTNHDADAFELNCFGCGEPVLVKWSFRHKRYEKQD